MSARRVRWPLLLWPLAVLLAVELVALAVIWSIELPQRQSRVVYTLLAAGLGSLLAMIWVPIWIVALSRLRLRARLLGLGLCAAMLAAVGLSLEHRGWSGDVVPLLRWRWARAPGELSIEPPAGAVGVGRSTFSSRDWPGFLGARRDGTVRGVQLSREWREPPRELWRRPIGAGWSGFAVVGDFAVTQEQRGPQELVSCFDLHSGELLWTHADATRHEDPLGGVGPRATPSVDRGRVYALGATGRLNALDLVSGELLWTRRILVDNRSSAPMYGVSASPLVVDGLVVVAAGGREGRSLVAYDAMTGDPVWAGGDAAAAYSSPMLASLAGVEQIVILDDAGLSAFGPSSGELLWSYPWPSVEKASQPSLIPPDRLFVSTGYGVGGKLLTLRPLDVEILQPELTWESRGLKAKFTNVVHRDGFLFGLDDGILACLDLQDGRRRWKGGRYGHGQILLVGDLLLVAGEHGEVALVEASPDRYVERASFQALQGKTWNHPALAGDRLLVRNDREAACFELPIDSR